MVMEDESASRSGGVPPSSSPSVAYSRSSRAPHITPRDRLEWTVRRWFRKVKREKSDKSILVVIGQRRRKSSVSYKQMAHTIYRLGMQNYHLKFLIAIPTDAGTKDFTNAFVKLSDDPDAVKIYYLKPLDPMAANRMLWAQIQARWRKSTEARLFKEGESLMSVKKVTLEAVIFRYLRGHPNNICALVDLLQKTEGLTFKRLELLMWHAWTSSARKREHTVDKRMKEFHMNDHDKPDIRNFLYDVQSMLDRPGFEGPPKQPFWKGL